jgi:hypothetical protein
MLVGLSLRNLEDMLKCEYQIRIRDVGSELVSLEECGIGMNLIGIKDTENKNKCTLI